MFSNNYDDLAKRVQELSSAEFYGDATTLNKILTDDFVGIGPRGDSLARDQWLARYSSGELTHSVLRWEDISMRVYEDAAIVTGRQTEVGRYRGARFRGSFRGTLVFVRDPGQRHGFWHHHPGEWRLAGVHLSPIVTEFFGD